MSVFCLVLHYNANKGLYNLNREDAMDRSRWKKLIKIWDGGWVNVSSGTGSPG